MKIQLPDRPNMKDIEAMARHYGLPAADDARRAMLDQFVKGNSLRKLVLHLKDGARAAVARNEEYEWMHFDRAVEIANKLERGDG